MEVNKIVFCWLRRDLRLNDNRALFEALNSGYKVQLLFIFDVEIIDELSPDDSRVSMIYNQLNYINQNLTKHQSSMLVRHGKTEDIFIDLIKEFAPVAIYANEDYEPYAIKRDKMIDRIAASFNIGFKTFKDQVIFSPNEILKKNGEPYTVFTPWYKKWYEKIQKEPITVYKNAEGLAQLNISKFSFPTLKSIGFKSVNVSVNIEFPSFDRLRDYVNGRDYPSVNGTSRLSVALRFGFISIRELIKYVFNYEKFMSELAWREFYMMIIYHFPLVVHQSFKKQYDNIEWINNQEHFEKWKLGQTGYPLVDAGMRELLNTGYMHNRLRMVVASFLTKHLLTDWRWGEAWFAKQLQDFELASNNGSWQWAAGTGCDAAPYFRIFNPTEQQKKFDSDLSYIRKWVPEIDRICYLSPIVEHRFARQRALDAYKKALK